MLLITVTFFLFTGLYFLGEAVRRLWLLEWQQMNPTPNAAEKEKDNKNDDDDEGPKLTKLGRPITEIKLSA